GATPNSKTITAIRQQAPVLVENLAAHIAGKEPAERYGAYASRPLTPARDNVQLAEFDYPKRTAPNVPGIDNTRERKDMWYLKRYGLPFMYWNLILKGLA